MLRIYAPDAALAMIVANAKGVVPVNTRLTVNFDTMDQIILNRIADQTKSVNANYAACVINVTVAATVKFVIVCLTATSQEISSSAFGVVNVQIAVNARKPISYKGDGRKMKTMNLRISKLMWMSAVKAQSTVINQIIALELRRG